MRRTVRRRARVGCQRWAPDEQGAASVLVVALTGVVVLIGLASTFVVATAAGHRRAQGAADLAALAGATAQQDGGDPCTAAARIAEANGAKLSGCAVLGDDIAVTALAVGPRFLGHGWDLTGRARAGP